MALATFARLRLTTRWVCTKPSVYWIDGLLHTLQFTEGQDGCSEGGPQLLWLVCGQQKTKIARVETLSDRLSKSLGTSDGG